MEAVARHEQVTVRWNSVAGADAYTVYWATTADAVRTTGTKIENVQSPYVHRGLINDMTYYYVVTAQRALPSVP
jgi:hypothetical protein